MVPKIAAKGRSFKGAAAYLLHDKDRANTSERVDWVETRNLATDNPELAWRIMAATALDQDRLKEAAGVRNTGRKSDQAVLHLVLSWHPDEREELSPDEMRRAAIGALKALGAEDRQSLFIAHNDEEHAHLHVLCNRVSPVDGRMLSSSNDRLKLSKWAQGYEMERGHIYCENRVVNNERRAQGEFVADAASLPYHQAANDPGPPSEGSPRAHRAVQDAQIERDRQLVRRGQEMASAYKAQWAALEERYQDRKAGIRAQAHQNFSQARSRIGQAYHPLRLRQNETHTAERAVFEEREAHLMGRIANTMKAIDHLRRMRGEIQDRALGESFKVLASTGARREALLAAQAQEKAELNRNQAKELNAARREIFAKARAERRAALSEHEASRTLLAERQKTENAALKERWRERTKERTAAWDAYRAAQASPLDLSSEFDAASRSAPAKTRKDGGGGIDQFLEEMDKLYSGREFPNDNRHDHDDDYEY